MWDIPGPGIDLLSPALADRPYHWITREVWGFLYSLFSYIISGQGFQQPSFLLSFWFIPPDGSTHPSNPDCEESGESSSSGSSEPEPPGHQLFCLEYEADSGDITSVIVYQVRLVETAAA